MRYIKHILYNTDLIKDTFHTKMHEIIEQAWQTKHYDRHTIEAVREVLSLLERGEIRVAEKKGYKWIVHEWIKKAILLYFVLQNAKLFAHAPTLHKSAQSYWFDKIGQKFTGWQESDFKRADLRVVPGAIVREGTYIEKKVVLMPCFINIGAYIAKNTLIDTWASVGSCAQIGENCHISGGVGIGGVLEPLQNTPVIIEDNCFIGARSEIAEGVIVERGAVLAMGVYLSQSTKIIDRSNNKVYYGYIPPYSVVVPGSTVCSNSGLSLYCAVIVKTVDENTRRKTSINALLRSDQSKEGYI